MFMCMYVHVLLRLPSGSAEPLRGLDDNGHALDAVVAEAVVVPERLDRLDVARAVRRAWREHVLAGVRLTVVRPAAPRVRGGRRAELRVGPGLAPVGRHLDAGDLAVARPCTALEHEPPRVHASGAREELGDPRRDEERARQHPGDGLTLLVLTLPNAIRDVLLPAPERLVGDRDRPEPLDVRHPVPARHD